MNMATGEKRLDKEIEEIPPWHPLFHIWRKRCQEFENQGKYDRMGGKEYRDEIMHFFW